MVSYQKSKSKNQVKEVENHHKTKTGDILDLPLNDL